jgi:hypothetical protein
MSLSKVSRIVSILLAIMVAVLLAQAAVRQDNLTRKELRALIASAKTPADHERIAAYYRAEAQHLAAKHREHEEDLAEYYKNPSRYPSKYPTMGDHCRSLASYYKMAAERASTLADMHEKVAQEAQ